MLFLPTTHLKFNAKACLADNVKARTVKQLRQIQDVRLAVGAPTWLASVVDDFRHLV